MEQNDDQDKALSGTALPPGSAVGLARRVAEVYGQADPNLRHAVRHSLQAGMPASVLNLELSPHLE